MFSIVSHIKKEEARGLAQESSKFDVDIGELKQRLGIRKVE